MPGLTWVTGAAGSIGAAVMERLDHAVGTDIEVDVTDAAAVRRFVNGFDPELIIHCAGAKHAPEGETDPWRVAEVNVGGTRNVLDTGRRVILASTCKAADPETAYGASKLIAERMVLNAGGSVARFFNVRQTSGNVFELWSETPWPQPLTVMPCWRFFIDLDQAVNLVLDCIDLPPGRYIVDPGDPVFIPDLAAGLYPGRDRNLVRPRRGDRVREPFHARSEKAIEVGGVLQVSGPHDFPGVSC